MYIKALISIVVPGFLFIFLGGCLAIRTDIEIKAKPEQVWKVLADTPRYPEWNPYHVRVEGLLKEGEDLEVELHKPNGTQLTIEPYVMTINPQKELTWGGGIPGIFYGEHVFLLEETEDGNTRLYQNEDFNGIAVPFASLETIEEGYHLMNRALKKRIESSENNGGL